MVSLASPDGPVLRLTVLWGEAVVDSFAVAAGPSTSEERRIGGSLNAGSLQIGWDAVDEVILLTLDGADVAHLEPGGEVELGGFTVRCRYDALSPRATRPLLLDGRWLQAVIAAAAFQFLVVSAMLLAPTPIADAEPGAGLTMADVERFLAVPAGGARDVGRATFAPTGKPPEEAERITHERPPLRLARRDIPTVTWSTTPAFLTESLRTLMGDEGATSELARTLGEEALATARSEQASAGVGGLLSPRPLVEPGAGSGTVGIGESQTQRILQANDARLEKMLTKKAPPRKEREIPKQQKMVFPVQTTAVPEGNVSAGSLDPVVKDVLALRVREHKNSIRYCYETFGLAADPNLSGRLVLELTLLPNGHVSDVDATVDGRGLDPVATCVEEQAAQWFLGDVLPDEAKRLRFPFLLCPKSTPDHIVFCTESWPSGDSLSASQ